MAQYKTAITKSRRRSNMATCRRCLKPAIPLLLLLVMGVNVWLHSVYLSNLQTPGPKKPHLPVQLAKKSLAYKLSATTLNKTIGRNSSDASSVFYIKDPKASYKMCDVLELNIEVRDNLSRKMGGKLMWPQIRTDKLKASAPADQLIDHGNGSYTARFTLTWVGEVEPDIKFMHTGEYVAALRSMRRREPAVRFARVGKFSAHGVTEFMPCHVTVVMPYVGTRPVATSPHWPTSKTCDFSHGRAGILWYCLKPGTLPCTAITQHRSDIPTADEFMIKVMTPEDKDVSKGATTGTVTLPNIGPVKRVHVAFQDAEKVTNPCLSLPDCTMGLSPKQPAVAAGFYYRDSWQSRVCRARRLHLPETLKCLRGKSLHFYGDSMLRQWFLYLTKNLGPTMRAEKARSVWASTTGPIFGADTANNITLTYRHNFVPFHSHGVGIDMRDVKSVVDVVDTLPGGPHIVVVFSFWAHFTATNLTDYKSRMENVRAAVQRLQQRGLSPSPVFIKSASAKGERRSTKTSADFFDYELDQVMRTLFIGMPYVTIIDAWDMNLGHRTAHQGRQPTDVVIREEIKMFLNFLCR